MLNPEEQLLAEGRKWYGKFANDTVLPLDFTDDSLEHVQTLLDSMPINEQSHEYQKLVTIGLATYLADYFCQLFPDYHPEVRVNGKEIEEVSATKEGGWQVNFLSWVVKAKENPEDNLAAKFRVMAKRVAELS